VRRSVRRFVRGEEVGDEIVKSEESYRFVPTKFVLDTPR